MPSCQMRLESQHEQKQSNFLEQVSERGGEERGQSIEGLDIAGFKDNQFISIYIDTHIHVCVCVLILTFVRYRLSSWS